MSLVGKTAPDFRAPAVVNGEFKEIALSSYKGNQEVLMFFFPKTFTNICHSEVVLFEQRFEDFKKRNVAILSVSTDTEENQKVWIESLVQKGEISKLSYPMVSDASHTISYNYGVLAGDWETNEDGLLIFEGAPVAYRGVFIIDKAGVVRHELVNDLLVGRSIEYALQTIDDIQHVSATGEQCLAKH